MDLLTRQMPRWASRSVELLYAIIGIVIFLMIAKKTSGEIGFLRSIPETTEFLKLPIWLYYAGIAVLSVIMVLMFVIRILRTVGASSCDTEVGQ